MSKTSKYETVIIFDAQVAEEDLKASVEKFKDLIAANGTVDSVDEWGKRKLAYEIDKKTEGYYVLINFTSPAEFVKELTRVYNITDTVMRHLTVVAGE